jgi:hypothetical protein
MNPELPPLPLSQPTIRARRREKPPFIQLPAVSIASRTNKCRILRREIAEITNIARQLSPEQRRAIFLKLRHDRPLTKLDLKGTGLVLMAPSAEKESLVVSRKEDLAKLDKRLEEFVADQVSDRPKSTEFVTGVNSISIADPKDRLSPDLASEYEELVTEEFVIFEIEVASFAMQSSTRAREVKATLEELRQFLGAVDGRVYETDFAGSGARAVLSSTGAKLKALVDDPRWWRRIVFFDKRPQFQTFQNVYQNFSISNSTITAPPSDAETICIIDTGVAAANPFLENVLRTDISRSFLDGFTPDTDSVGHGSGVASLAAYYQIDMTAGGSNIASAFVVSARITNDDGQLDTVYTDDDGVHRVRQARLLSNMLKDVVQHFRPLGVRVFVLSFNIVGHIWSQATQQLVPRNSWVARTIDQLSKEHDVIFIAITGNITPSDLNDLVRERAYPGYLVQPLAKLLDPGQAALAVTVGSIAQSERVIVAPAVPIAKENQPSPFTRTGPGFDDSVKPDFVERGGNLVNDQQLGISHNAGTNVVMASGQLTPPLQHSNGTSFAGPRVANHIVGIIRDLRAVVPEPSAPLLRAFMALSAISPSNSPFSNLDDSLNASGYGLPDAARATDCAGHSVVLFHDGSLEADRVALFRIPVPIEIRDSGRALKLISVSIATAPAVQAWGVAEYLAAKLKFRLFRGDKSVEDIVAMMQREDGDENLASQTRVGDLPGKLKVRRRSVGTLQRDIFEWNDHEEAFSADDYILGVSLSVASWCKADPPIVPIGIAIRIEDTSGICQQLYARVRARVQAQARAQA